MDTFCRGCLVKHDDPTELLQYTVKNRRLFVYSTGLQVKKDDTVPFQLCKECYVNMKLSCKFKKQCRTSDKKLKNYIEIKEIGDAADLSTFLNNNDDVLKFPTFSGNSTPVAHKIRDDDNESTCTSIRNFMSDMLQGEEMPDTEERIVREVIEEEADGDDSLDSHWLQDDISIDTDFRLDFSFSPFSTPRTVNNDRYASQKTIESVQHTYASAKKTNQTSKDNSKNIKREVTKSHVSPVKVKHNSSKDLLNYNNESQNSFGDLIDQNVNFFTQNENDIDLEDISTNEMKNQNDNYYVSKTETEIAIKHIKIDLKNFGDQNNPIYDIQIDNVTTNEVSDENDGNHNIYSSSTKTETDLAVRFIESTMNDINQNEILTKDNIEDQDLDMIDMDTVSSVDNNLFYDSEKKKAIISNDEKKDCLVKTIKSNENVLHVESGDENSDKDYINAFTIGNNKQDAFKCEENQDKLDEVLQDKDCVDFPFGDLTFSPTAYLPLGGSTPMINNILFAEKLDIDDRSNSGDKENTEVDVLDEMLKEGVKEFGIPDLEYDLDASLCKICDKKFIHRKALKVHLTKRHHLKLPAVKKSRESENMMRICYVCGNQFHNLGNFLKHLDTHPKKQKECNVCKLTFSSKSKLKMHLVSHDAFQAVNEPPKQEFVCTICGQSLTSAGNFSVHMRRHKKKFSSICKECGKGFYRKPDLTIHMRQHTGEKPFSCDHCKMSFTRRYNLIKHMKRHLEDRPFQCHHCAKRFVLRSDLVIHFHTKKSCMSRRVGELKRRGVKPYKCYYCNKTFANQNNLVKHQNNYGPCIKKQNNIDYRNKSTMQMPYMYVLEDKAMGVQNDVEKH